MILNPEELQKLLKEKGIKTTEDLNSFMSEFTKQVIETLYEGEMEDHLGHSKIRRGKKIVLTLETATLQKQFIQNTEK